MDIKIPKIDNLAVSGPNKQYRILCYVICTLLTFAGLFLAYEIVFNCDLTFSAEWNIFNSTLGVVCILVGFILAMLRWGKLGHYTSTPVVETRDSSGRLLERKENYDVTDQLLGRVVFPLLGHFILEPIAYGCMIYYPLQCIIAIIGFLFPYLIALLLVVICVMCWIVSPQLTMPKRFWLTGGIGILLIAAFCWGGYVIEHPSQTRSEPRITYTHLPSNVSSVRKNSSPSTSKSSVKTSTRTSPLAKGLYDSLPPGESVYEGDMAGFPIRFTIIKKEAQGDVEGTYENIKYGTVMKLYRESLPAMNGDINFFGKDRNTDWTFYLTGNPSNISGTANADEKSLKINLRRI